jgi:hypothetical protein
MKLPVTWQHDSARSVLGGEAFMHCGKKGVVVKRFNEIRVSSGNGILRTLRSAVSSVEQSVKACHEERLTSGTKQRAQYQVSRKASCNRVLERFLFVQ